MMKRNYILLPFLMLVITSCNFFSGKKEVGSVPIDFKPWVIADSAKLVSFPSGLKMYIEEEGPGDIPQSGMNVNVHYYGTFEDGTVFDSSFERGEPLSFILGKSGGPVKGFTEGIRNLRLGSKAILILPPSLAYGENGLSPNIPPNSTLIFQIELLGSF